jgi:hypothetical protein
VDHELVEVTGSIRDDLLSYSTHHTSFFLTPDFKRKTTDVDALLTDVDPNVHGDVATLGRSRDPEQQRTTS